MLESGDFSSKIEQCAKNLAVNGEFAWIKGNFGEDDLKRSFGIFAWKIKTFRKFVWKNRNFVDPDPRPPDFKPYWRRCGWVEGWMSMCYVYVDRWMDGSTTTDLETANEYLSGARETGWRILTQMNERTCARRHTHSVMYENTVSLVIYAHVYCIILGEFSWSP